MAAAEGEAMAEATDLTVEAPALADEAQASVEDAELSVAEKYPLPLEERSFFDRYIRDRLSVGVTVVSASLSDAERAEDKGGGQTFVGFIYKLEDVDKTTVVPTVSYWVPECWLRFTFSWDSISGRTRNYNKARHSDGVVKTDGPVFMLEAVLPLFDNRLLLHAGAGVVVAKSDFEEVTWWNLGFSSEESWKARGAPTSGSERTRYREIQVDDVTAPIFSGGVAWRIFERLELDVSARYVKMEPDCEFGYSHGGHFSASEGGEFTLDHTSVAATVSYVF